MAKTEALPLLLKQLGLFTMLMYWQEYEAIAMDKQYSYSQYLATLAELEANARYAKRVAYYTKESKLPPGKSLATFDFTVLKSVNPQKFLALADNLSWIKNAHNLVLFGPSGVGKTHLAAAIGYSAIAQGIRCLFTSTTKIVQKLQLAKQQYKLPEVISKLSRYPLLILDDIGYAKKNEMETSVLFELIAERYENSSIIITSNQPFAEWDSIFPDNMMAVAAIDRLVHHAVVINIPEKSFRQTCAYNKQIKEEEKK